MNNMSDLSFTQTSRAMSSTHVPRVKHEYRPIWVIAATNNAKPKKGNRPPRKRLEKSTKCIHGVLIWKL